MASGEGGRLWSLERTSGSGGGSGAAASGVPDDSDPNFFMQATSKIVVRLCLHDCSEIFKVDFPLSGTPEADSGQIS